MQLTIYKKEEVIPEVAKIDEDFEFNLVRVRCADAMQKCLSFANNQMFDDGKRELTHALTLINNSKSIKISHKMQSLREDIR